MPNAGAPPFQYSKRGSMLSRLDGQMLAAATEDRDRELEDFLAWLNGNAGGGTAGPPGPAGPAGPAGPQGPAGTAPDEVFVGPADPGGTYELWYDSDDPGPTGTLGTVARRYATSSATITAIATADITASAGAAPAINIGLNPARLYRFQFNTAVLCQGAVTDRLVLELWDNTAVVRSYQWGPPAINQGYAIHCAFIFYPPSNAVQNWRMRTRHLGGGPFTFQSVNGQMAMDFLIEDVGVAQ